MVISNNYIELLIQNMNIFARLPLFHGGLGWLAS